MGFALDTQEQGYDKRHTTCDKKACTQGIYY